MEKNKHRHLHIDINQTFQPYFWKQELILDRWQEHESKVTFDNPI
jgi:hypothetical protein